MMSYSSEKKWDLIYQEHSKEQEKEQKQSKKADGSLENLPQTDVYVRALYNYEADDLANLSFSKGDIIKVITRLESGWWDGILNGVRGWFPSSYCQVVSSPDEVLVAAPRIHKFFEDDTADSPLDQEELEALLTGLKINLNDTAPGGSESDWIEVSDVAESRRIQGRIKQREYRMKLKKRLEALQQRAVDIETGYLSVPPETHKIDDLNIKEDQPAQQEGFLDDPGMELSNEQESKLSSLDGSNVASGKTFALDETAKLRSNDGMNLKAIEYEPTNA
ncbi:hypothetical protein OCU04_007138 [Sclerotinia nivalis]|uniref:Class E vacuolar protein-sorting machinery protein HSE1 n=1 Tax=Sclerotinia nivalis TaxID=352851 RepID=A0A9X0DJM6_9HELO|nr:hypothetical protein OCU04_007138 [Sclerotinia nivalis]